MNNTIEQARNKAGYRSNDALALAMLKHEPSLEDRIKARSLGAKIGSLARGRTDWWLKDELALTTLKAVLDADDADLGIHARRTDHLFLFREFPELPPLDLRREMPCEYAYGAPEGKRQSIKELKDRPLDLDAWLMNRDMGDHRNMPYGVSWLQMSMGLDADMLVARLKASSPFEVLQVPSLQEAQSRLQNPRPFILVISSVKDEEDLLSLSGAQNVLVLSPAPWPVLDGMSQFEFRLDWEFQQGSAQDRARQTLADPYGIHRYRWTLHPDWRASMVGWLHARLKAKNIDTLLDAQELEHWLVEFDPEERLIRTPSDLLAVARMFHSHAKRSRPRARGHDSARHLQTKLLPLDSRLSETFNRLATEHWRHTDLHWGCPQEWTTWIELSRGGVRTGVRDRTTRKTIRQDTQLESLLSSELLIQQPRTESGDYALNPQLLADLHVRELLMDEIRSGDFHSWGRAALDPARQPLVDAALAATPEHDLLQTVRNLQKSNLWEPSSVGASESLFLALGYRQAHGDHLSPEMLEIAEMVLRRYVETGGDEGSSLLMSRFYEAGSDHPDVLMLLAACLGWSLSHKPRLIKKVDDRLQQLFPGWMGKNSSFHALPNHPVDDSYSIHSTRDSSPKWRAFLKVVFNVYLHTGASKWLQDEESSNLVVPLQMTSALLKGEPVSADWVHKVVRHRWAVSFVLDQLKDRHSLDAAPRVFEAMLDCAYEGLVADKKYGFIEMDSLFNSRLWHWAAENTQPLQVIPVKDKKRLAVLRRMPHVLPPAFRRELLASLPVGYLFENQNLIRCAGKQARSLLMDRLGSVEGGLAASRLWSLDPEGALSLLQSNRLEPMSAIQMVGSSPQHLAAEVAKFLMANPDLLGKGERRAWVLDRMRTNVDAADELFELLRLEAARE